MLLVLDLADLVILFKQSEYFFTSVTDDYTVIYQTIALTLSDKGY